MTPGRFVRLARAVSLVALSGLFTGFVSVGFVEEAFAAEAASNRPVMNAKAKRPYDAGQKAFSTGDLAGAKKQFTAAIESDKNAYEAHFALGATEERRGQAAAALKGYKQSLAIVPDYEAAIAAVALVMSKGGDHDGAARFVEERLPKTKNRAVLLTALAEVKSRKGESGEAQRLAQEALKANPDYRPAMVTLARDHYRARRIDLSLYALTGILDGYGEDNPARDKNNAEARLLRGIIYSERGMRGPAMEELEKAVKTRPDLVDAHLVLATYMLEAGNAKGATPHLEMAVRYDNANVAAHLHLGDAYRLLDRAADARREFEWVLKKDPKRVSAHYGLGLVFLLSAKVPGLTPSAAADKAVEQFEAYKSKAPRGGPDDVDELITRAKTKKALIEAEQQEKQQTQDKPAKAIKPVKPKEKKAP